MRRWHAAILQHGAILLDWDGVLQAGTMGLVDDRFLRASVTTLAEQLGRVPDRAALEQALVDAFAAELGVAFEPGTLSTAEIAREDALAPTFVVGR